MIYHFIKNKSDIVMTMPQFLFKKKIKNKLEIASVTLEAISSHRNNIYVVLNSKKIGLGSGLDSNP